MFASEWAQVLLTQRSKVATAVTKIALQDYSHIRNCPIGLLHALTYGGGFVWAEKVDG